MPAPFRPTPPMVIGLVGGIAAGKSAVAAAFADRGLAILDADRVAREVVRQPEVIAALRREFGDRIFAPPTAGSDGEPTLDREALANEVFANPAARKRLEAITHPPIRARLLAELARHLEAGRSAVLDAPLLLEGGLDEHCDRVVFVAAADATRRARAAARGWAPEELARREANQLPLAVKSARADATVQNDGSLAETRSQVAAILTRWLAP